MKQVSVSEFKNQFDDLVQQVFNGEEVEVCDNGHSFKLVPTQQAEDCAPEEVSSDAPARPRRKAGSMKGLIVYMADDFDAPLEEFKEYM